MILPHEGGLPPSIDWALAQLGGADSARRAAAALERSLAGLRGSVWPEVAWRSSRLNASGFPVELSVSSSGAQLRWAAEVAGPEAETGHRLARAAALLVELGRAEAPRALLDRLARLQGDGPLAWGAWLGGRHGEARGDDRFKLYAETPRGPAAAALLADEVGALALHRRCELLMVGHEPSAARSELYFRTAGLEVGELAWLLARSGQGGRERELVELIEDLWGRPAVFGAGSLGFSLSHVEGAASDRFTLFKPAGALCGDDRRVRRRLLELAERRGLGFAGYPELTRSLDGKPGRGAHGLVAFVAAAGRPIELTVGLCPKTLFDRAS